jgi:hypothetical protein
MASRTTEAYFEGAFSRTAFAAAILIRSGVFLSPKKPERICSASADPMAPRRDRLLLDGDDVVRSART